MRTDEPIEEAVAADAPVVDEAEVEQFLGQVVGDLGAALAGLLTYVGDRLGLYRAMADGTAVRPEELATRTGTNERMVREWLSAQAAGGYVTYDADDGSFALPPAHALALAGPDSPASVVGFVQMITSGYRSADRLVEAFRTGRGLGWGDHHHELFEGMARTSEPTLRCLLLAEWLPAVDGVVARLEAGGATAADIGCGHGVATRALAAAYPEAAFVGFDAHEPSIERARKDAAGEGLGGRASFEVASATEFPGEGYALVTFFDSLHDLGDPLGAARRARQAIAPDGVVLVVDPLCGDRLEQNLNPLGRMFYAGSTVFCTPCSLDQGGPALGAQAGPARLRALLEQAGFSRVRAVAQSPFNLVLEARP